MIRITEFAGLVLMFAFLVSSCGTGENTGDASTTKTLSKNSRNTLVTTIVVTDSNREERSVFSKGEPLVIRIVKTNDSGESRSMEVVSGKKFDLSVYDLNDTLVWSPVQDQALAGTRETLIFTPHETKTFEETWTQISQRGVPVPSGHYVINADDAEPCDILIE